MDLWSSLLRDRLLLMKGTAARVEVWRDEKLRLLQRRRAGLAGRDAGLVGWLRLPLCKLPPTLVPPEIKSPLLLLRLLLRPQIILGFTVLLLPACLLPLDTGTVKAARSFRRERKTETVSVRKYVT